MRTIGLRRTLAAFVAGTTVMASALPAAAVPAPRSDEWWFRAWSIQDQVWPLSRGAGITVAVLDTGVNAKLPELSGVVLQGGDTAGSGTDGRVDLDEGTGEGQGHGTSMAALIAGQGGGTSGVVGVAPDAQILPVHVTTSIGGDSDSAMADGIRFATDHGAKVISVSVGHDSFDPPDNCPAVIHSAVEYAVDHDVVIVAAAGNNGRTTNAPGEPGSCAGVVAVGGVTESSQPWPDTQRQPYVAVAAPASPVGQVGKDGAYYPQAQGTSGAAALTAGAVALIRSHNPTMSARTVVQRLLATALHIGPPGHNDQTGYGIVLIRGAMDPAHFSVPVNAPNPVYEAYDKWQAAQVTNSTSVNAPSLKQRSSTMSPKRGNDNPPLIIASLIGLLVTITAGSIGVFALRRKRHGSAGA